MIVVEAIRTAQEIHGQQPLTGEQVRDGLENLNITEERLAELGMTDFTPLKVTCADHEGDPRNACPAVGRQTVVVRLDWITR